MPITHWPHYADHPVALLCRSRPGSYMPVGDTTPVYGMQVGPKTGTAGLTMEFISMEAAA